MWELMFIVEVFVLEMFERNVITSIEKNSAYGGDFRDFKYKKLLDSY
jgi:hypothetical protein